MNPDAKNQVVERLNQASNVLVTVSNNPSVDQLSAAIGLTLLLNKMGKHATAVFSGQVPSTIEFLKPKETLEATTDSLRDFIISLDKSKADKLRYKVEDKVVKIFITPYRTTISDKDLEFSQGDFNVDVVMALGVHQQQDLDQAITSHGRILHDATVVAVNNTQNGDLGSINWINETASSLSEMLVSLGETLGPNLFDAQMANAFLTGIVAETDRFSNQKATPEAMAMASRLVATGANPQLIAKELEEKPPEPPPAASKPDQPKTPPPKPAPTSSDKDNGALSIEHSYQPPPPVKEKSDDEEGPVAKIQIDREGTLHSEEEVKSNDQSAVESNQGGTLPKLVTQAPTLGGTLTANTQPQNYSPSTDPLSQNTASSPLLSHTGETLSEIEQSVASPHLAQSASQPVNSPAPTPEQIDRARAAVNQAISAVPGDPARMGPIAALNAQPVDLDVPNGGGQIPGSQPEQSFSLPPNLVPPTVKPRDQTASPNGSSPPPPVPPPMVPPML